MNAKERALKAITESKQKLSTQKVELGVIDDFNKSVNRLKSGKNAVEKAAQEMLDDLQEFQKLQMKIKASFRKADNFAAQAQDEIDNSQKLADDIYKEIKRLGMTIQDLKSLDLDSSISFSNDIKNTVKTIRENEDLAKRILNV